MKNLFLTSLIWVGFAQKYPQVLPLHSLRVSGATIVDMIEIFLMVSMVYLPMALKKNLIVEGTYDMYRNSSSRLVRDRLSVHEVCSEMKEKIRIYFTKKISRNLLDQFCSHVEIFVSIASIVSFVF